MTDSATRRAFTSLVAAACIDGKLADPERAYLTRKAREFRIPLDEIDNYLRQGVEGKFTISIPPTQEGKASLFEELLDVVCADGRLESQEKQILLRFASHIGINAGDLGQRVRERMNARRPEPARVAPPPPKPEPPRVQHPEPVKFVNEAPQPRAVPTDVPSNPLMPGRDNLLTTTPGPVKLGGATSLSSHELSPITRELVKNVIRFEGRLEAADYLVRTAGIRDVTDALRIVDRIIVEEPACKPGEKKDRHGHKER